MRRQAATNIQTGLFATGIRRGLVLGGLLCGILAAPPALAAKSHNAKTVKAISKHFSGVPSLKGEFIQFGPRGQQTGGKFYLKRPGRIRFDYDKPSAISVFADGKTVAVNNKKLKTWDFIPLRKTPLKMLLANKINVGDKSIKSVKTEPDITTVVLGNRSLFGDSKITLMFDPTNFELRQWTITDNQGKDTSVMIFNVKKNVKLSNRLFKIDYHKIKAAQESKYDR